MTEAEEALEEKRFEERVGGSFEARESKDLFMLDNDGIDPAVKKEKKKRGDKPIKAWSLLNGLGGAPDPHPNRNRVRTKEEKEHPIIKKKRELRIKQGILTNKEKVAQKNRELNEERKKELKAQRKIKRLNKFDYDLWGEDTKASENGVDKSWIGKGVQVHTNIWTSNLKPKEAENRSNLKNKTLVDTVEVPHPGQSYNPTLSDHQELLWKAAMIEIDKEKAQKKIERLTTGMFPKANQAPTQETYYKEMSEGIAELQDKDEKKEEDSSDEDIPVEEEKEKVDGATPFRTKTLKQKRDAILRGREARKQLAKKREMDKEKQVFNLKSFKKEIAKEEKDAEKKEEKKAEKAIEKLKHPAQLSKYKYDPEEIPIKLSDELSGNLRNLKPEGSLLEDRFKSMQRRNMIETRVKQKERKKSRKLKSADKRSHKMGFEDKFRALQNQKIQKRRRRNQKMSKIKAKTSAKKSAVLQTTF